MAKGDYLGKYGGSRNAYEKGFNDAINQKKNSGCMLSILIFVTVGGVISSIILF